jgi:lipopolysaccharide export system permease protein
MTVLVGGLRPETGTFTDVFLFEPRIDGGSTVITARDGALGRAEDAVQPVLRLFDGIRLAVTEADPGRPATGAETVGVLRFAELRTVMTDEKAELFRPRGGDRREYTLDELWWLRHMPPEGLRRGDIVSELNVRIVQSLSVLVLPFLAIALALGRRRNDRIYGIAFGLLLLIGYNQSLDFGKNLVQEGKVGPELALWLPFVVFALGSALAFHRAAERVPRGFRLPAPGWLARAWLSRRRRPGEGAPG